MTRLPVQRTRLQGVLSQLARSLRRQLGAGWRHGSAAVLALLVGFFLAQNLTTLLLLSVPGGRPVVVLAMVVAIELLVRFRSRWLPADPSLPWVLVDNLRIGAVYAVVLEAFKLGT